MRLFPFLLLGVCTVFGQVPASPPPSADEPSPDTVVASFEGKKLTYGEMKKFLGVLPPAQQQAAMRDRKTFVHEYFLMQHLADLAEKEKLDEKSPVKETLDFNRRIILMNAKLNDVANHMTVDEVDVKKYYETNRDKYSQVKLKVLYISFSSNPNGGTGVTKPLTEEEAKSKIEKILTEIRGGADFVKMVKQYSEDKTSAEKDGDFGSIRKSDNVPEPIRAVVFSLKPGEVGGPVRQPNGFYLFRADEVTTRTYQQVQMEIYEQARQAKYQQWMAQLNGSMDFKVENENFFKAPAPPPATAPQLLPVK